MVGSEPQLGFAALRGFGDFLDKKLEMSIFHISHELHTDSVRIS